MDTITSPVYKKYDSVRKKRKINKLSTLHFYKTYVITKVNNCKSS